MKNILIVCPFFPYPADTGSKNRVYNFLEHLSTKHHLTLLCYFDNSNLEHLDKLKKYCKLKTVLRPNKKSLIGKIYYKIQSLVALILFGMPNEVFYSSIHTLGKQALKLLEKERFDIVHVEYWYTGLSSNFIAKSKKVFKVVDTIDVQPERFEQILGSSFLDKRQKKYINKMEKRALSDYDALLAITNKDKKSFKKYFSSKDIITIYNGFQTPEKSESPPKKTKNIVFFGGLAYQVNIDAVHYFVQSIYPKIKEEVSDVSFTILGSSPPQEILRLPNKDSSIKVTGYVEDIDFVLKKAYLAVLPLNIEYGLRVRALELASRGMPIVATKKSVSGIDFTDKENIIFASDANEFAINVIKLLKDPELARNIGEAARKFVNYSYCIDKTYGKLADYYESIK